MPEDARARWRCGFVPEHRLPDLEPDPKPHPLLPLYAPPPVSQECPGFLIQQPEVVDALHAHLWWEKGQLERYVRDQPVSPFLEMYVDAVTSAVAELDLEREKERERARAEAEAAARRR